MNNQSDIKRAIYKDWALNNTKVKEYCNLNQISLKLLKNMQVDYVIDRIVFMKPSDVKPKGLLDNDIDTQPKAVLGVVVSNNNGKISVKRCESTKYTELVKVVRVDGMVR